MSYSGTDNSSLNVKEIAISNMILSNAKNQFDVNLSANEIITNLIQNLTQQIEELKTRLDTQTTTVYTGTIQPYAGLALDPTSHTVLPPPPNYEWCFGQIVSKSDEKYSALYSVIGDYWNTSTELTDDQFQLPDLRNVFLRGCPEYIEGSENNRLIGNFQQSGVPNINASWFSDCIMFSYAGDTTGAVRPTWIENYNLYNKTDGAGNVIHKKNFNASWVSSVYKDGLTEVRPDNKAVNYIIKL